MIHTDIDGKTWLLIDPRHYCYWCENKLSRADRKKLHPQDDRGYHPDCQKQMFDIEAQKRSGAIHEV